MSKVTILLFGTGPMAYEYAKVLKQMEKDFIVIGRGQQSAKIFQEKTSIKPFTGGAAKFLSSSDYSLYKAIVAVTGDQLGKVALELIKYRVKAILLEKPGGLDDQEIKLINDTASKHSAKVYIAYNRRFYASTIKAKEIIKKDGGVLSFHFEFNEPIDAIFKSSYLKRIKDRWLLHNSTHVIDLAFFLGGAPKLLNAQTFKNRIFIGQGIRKTDAPFTYHANWLAPGRWSLELMTKNHRLIFRPLETLQAQKSGSFNIFSVELDDKLDTDFKPGLFKEVEVFLKNTPLKKSLCTIEEQINNLLWYRKILKGS